MEWRGREAATLRTLAIASPHGKADFILPPHEDVLPWLARLVLSQQYARLPFLNHIVVLLPHSNAIPRFKQELLSQSSALGYPALLGINVTTLKQWLISFDLPQQYSRPENHTRELIFVELLQSHREQLGIAAPWNFVHSLLHLFDEMTLEHTCIDPDERQFRGKLHQAYGYPDKSASLEKEAAIVHTLWHAWHTQMHNNAWLDSATEYALKLNQGIGQNTSQKDKLHFYVLGGDYFHQTENHWLTQLAHQHQLTFIDIMTPGITKSTYHHCLQEIFFPSGDQSLRERARSFALNNTLNPLKERLSLFTAAHREQEALVISAQISQALQKNPYYNIAIITEDRRLARRLRALLERQHIALMDVSGWALTTTSCGTAVERWLQCVEEDFPCRELLDLLKSPFVFTHWDRHPYLASIYRLEHDIILQENVPRHLEYYRQKLHQRAKRLNEPLLTTEHITRLDEIIAILAKSAQGLRALNNGKKYSASCYCRELINSMTQLSLLAGLQNDPAGSLLLEKLNQLSLIDAEHQLNWLEFRRWFGNILENTFFNPPTSASNVYLYTQSQSQMLRFDLVILAGCDAKKVNGKNTLTPYFNNHVRTQLGLISSEQFYHIKLKHFYLLLQSAPRVLMTYSQSQNGETLLPSPWLALLQTFSRLAYDESLENKSLADELYRQAETTALLEQPLIPSQITAPAPILLPQLMPEVITASAYQQLMNCPYQFYAARCLKLQALEDLRLALSKADYGERVHLCLNAFHKKVDALPEPFTAPLTIHNRHEAIAHLEKISEAVFSQDVVNNFQHHAWLTRWKHSIPHYIDWQTPHQNQWRVTKTEHAVKIGNFHAHVSLKGRLDRIDSNQNGEWLIMDYKTGTPPSKELVLQGEEVQLAFYTLLVTQPVIKVHYLVFKKDNISVTPALEGEELDWHREQNQQRLQTLITAIKNGTPLPAWGDEHVCQRCQFMGLCRKQSWA